MTYKNKENTQPLVWLVIAKKHNLLPFRIISHQIKQLDLSQNSSQNQKNTLFHISPPQIHVNTPFHTILHQIHVFLGILESTLNSSLTHTQKQLVRVFFLTKFKRAHLISSFLIITRIVDPVIVFLTNMQQTYPT